MGQPGAQPALLAHRHSLPGCPVSLRDWEGNSGVLNIGGTPDMQLSPVPSHCKIAQICVSVGLSRPSFLFISSQATELSAVTGVKAALLSTFLDQDSPFPIHSCTIFCLPSVPGARRSLQARVYANNSVFSSLRVRTFSKVAQ